MKNTYAKPGILIISLLLLIGNITPLFAQTLELEVIGGGFKLQGPESINFNAVQTSFSAQNTQISFRAIEMENPDSKTLEAGGIIIIDENGGKAFSVSVSGENLISNGGTCTGPQPFFNCISASNFQIRNWDNAQSAVEALYGSAQDLTVNASTSSFVALNSTQTLADGTGRAPGMWKIFPELSINIPAGQNPGEYSGTISFTIT